MNAMHTMMVKQLLSSAGVSDERVLAMVDNLMGGGLKEPTIAGFDEGSFLVPEGADAVRISARGVTDKVTIFVITERT